MIKIVFSVDSNEEDKEIVTYSCNWQVTKNATRGEETMAVYILSVMKSAIEKFSKSSDKEITTMKQDLHLVLSTACDDTSAHYILDNLINGGAWSIYFTHTHFQKLTNICV